MSLISAARLSWIITVCAGQIMICGMWATFIATFRTNNHSGQYIWKIARLIFSVLVAIIAEAVILCNCLFFRLFTKDSVPVIGKLFLAYAIWSWSRPFSAIAHLFGSFVRLFASALATRLRRLLELKL